MKNDSISRRELLQGAAAAAAWASAPALASAPAWAAGEKIRKPRKLSPDKKMNIACVGCGGKGNTDVRAVSGENIVALCDVDFDRAEKSFALHPGVPKFRDYREMFAKMGRKIDAVTVTTPDHMHYAVAKKAIEMGKHVFVQKPLTHSVWEARQLTELARKHGVATQMGNQGQAGEDVRVLCELLWDGAIGPVHEVHVWTNRPIWPQAIARPEAGPKPPKSLDWDLWLGVAPVRPYHPAYHPFKWRGWRDFGTGALGDMACHAFAPIFRALKLGHPSSVETSSTALFEETYPSGSIVRYEFPAREGMPPVALTWYDGGLKPPRPKELEADRELGKSGTLYLGEKGAMLGARLLPESRMRAYKRPAEYVPRSIGHYAEWIQACKGGDAGGSNFDISGPQAETVLLGNISMRTGKKLAWDGPNLKITNEPEANQYLRREYRKGWGV